MKKSVGTGFYGIFGFVAALITLGSFASYAQISTDRELVLIEDQLALIKFSDGRVAQVEVAFGSWSFVPFYANWSHSVSCGIKTIGETCSLPVPVAIDSIRLKWIEHPMSEKIGHVVKFSNQKQDAIVSDLVLGFSGPERPDPGPLSLSCPGNKAALKDIDIDAWLSEVNGFNGQTQVSENLTASGRYNVKLKASGENWVLVDPGQGFGDKGSLKFFLGLLGDVMTLYSEQLGENCSMTFKGNITNFFDRFTTKVSPGLKFQPYMYKRHGVLDTFEGAKSFLRTGEFE